MDLRVEKWTKEKWEVISADAHIVCFGLTRPSHLDRVDYANMLLDENDHLAGYATVLEMDSETAYLQYGGIFPNYKDTIYPLKGFMKMLGRMSEQYKRVTCKVENTNKVFLKFCLKADFVPVGVTNFKGKILVDFCREFHGSP